MTKQTDFSFAKIGKEQSKELTTMVNETLATDFVSTKNFTIVDLCHIRRQGKSKINSRRMTAFI